MTENYYPELSPLSTGLAGRCPRCGRGKLFDGYLNVAKSCRSCGLSYAFADSGDGAAWFVMLFVCVVGVGSILGIEIAYAPPFWVHLLLAIPILIHHAPHPVASGQGLPSLPAVEDQGPRRPD